MKKLLLIFVSILLIFSVSCTNEITISSDPDEIIKEYAIAISEGKTEILVELYGGDYEWMAMFSPIEDRENKKEIFENYLQVIPEKIYFNEIIEKEVLSEDEIIYTITFKREDETLFDVGDTQSRNSHFRYTVKMIDGQYQVMDPPPYQA